MWCSKSINHHVNSGASFWQLKEAFVNRGVQDNTDVFIKLTQTWPYRVALGCAVRVSKFNVDNIDAQKLAQVHQTQKNRLQVMSSITWLALKLALKRPHRPDAGRVWSVWPPRAHSTSVQSVLLHSAVQSLPPLTSDTRLTLSDTLSGSLITFCGPSDLTPPKTFDNREVRWGQFEVSLRSEEDWSSAELLQDWRLNDWLNESRTERYVNPNDVSGHSHPP